MFEEITTFRRFAKTQLLIPDSLVKTLKITVNPQYTTFLFLLKTFTYLINPVDFYKKPFSDIFTSKKFSSVQIFI